MFKVRQKNVKDSEDRDQKKSIHKLLNNVGGVIKTVLNTIIRKLKSSKIIILLCLATASFMIIPLITILFAFSVGFLLRFKGKKL